MMMMMMIYTSAQGPFSPRSTINILAMYDVVLNGPVLCSWMLFVTLMWPFITLLRAVSAAAVAILLQFPYRLKT